VKNSPEHERQAVYDLARYKLKEQFTRADVKDIRRTQQALVTAPSGEIFRQQISISTPPLIILGVVFWQRERLGP
jgi:hypothetical protein